MVSRISASGPPPLMMREPGGQGLMPNLEGGVHHLTSWCRMVRVANPAQEWGWDACMLDVPAVGKVPRCSRMIGERALEEE